MMNKEELSQSLAGQIAEVQEYLDSLFYWLQHCTEIDSKEYQKGMDMVEELLEKLHLFNPSNNQSEHPKITLSDPEGNVLGTSESTKGTKKDDSYSSTTTFYDDEGFTIGRCDSGTSKVYHKYIILYLKGIHLYEGYTIDDIKKIEVASFGGTLVEYLVLTSMEYPMGSKDTVRCTTLALTDDEAEDE